MSGLHIHVQKYLMLIDACCHLTNALILIILTTLCTCNTAHVVFYCMYNNDAHSTLCDC